MKRKLQRVREQEFSEILGIIQGGRETAYTAVNIALIETYWAIGAYLSRRMQDAGWGKGVVKSLANWLKESVPDLKGFSAQNLWRMKQFYDSYVDTPELSALLRELSWTSHCILMAQCKLPEEKMYYLQLSTKAGWSSRELENQIKRGTYERTKLADEKLSAVLRELPQKAVGVFKDSYLLDFINLSAPYYEKDLQSALVKNLCNFLIELGDGFTFVGEKVRLQVGNSDFELDLLFFHRDLRCLVAFEIKTSKFEPGHLGQLSFYLEALDRQNKRPHENPSIGVLLCQSKDDEVVEYALNRSLSPTLVAEYEHRLIPKDLLKQKMHEWTTVINERLKDEQPSGSVLA